MIHFIFVRHGETDFNKQRIFQGQFDSNLTELGFAQAELVAHRITSEYHIDVIYSSDLSRAARTADAIARAVGLDVITDPAFREVDVGRWMQQKVSEALKNDPELAHAMREHPGTFRYPDGETLLEVYERASAKIEEIVKGNDRKTIVVVSHGGTIRSLVIRWLGYHIDDYNKLPSMPNTSITVVEYEGGKFTPVLIGDNSHLLNSV